MATGLIGDVERRRRECGESLDWRRRSELGQFFTPSDLSAFMASMFEVSDHPARLLDPGAGVGSLAAAVADRWRRDGGGPLDITAVETDPGIQEPLTQTMEDLRRLPEVTSAVVAGDFIEWGSDRLSGFGAVGASKFDLVIMNPPYRKIHSASLERRRLAGAGIEAPNLYAGFVALAAGLLEDGGQLVAITPRSFTNGPYFRKFRRLLLERIGLRRIHVFESRDVAFADSEVLQENVIIHGTRGEKPKDVVVSSSRSAADEVKSRAVPYREVVRPDDPEAFIYITLDEASALCARNVQSLPCRMEDLELSVSTGPVVDFRVKDHLRHEFSSDTVPLVYPTHLRGGRVVWPKVNGSKPNALARNEEIESMLMPAGSYVLLRRFSAKEERRRVMATVVSVEDLPGDAYAFENHLNVIHRCGRGLPESTARGLAAFLNTTIVDQFFRQFNGHTQVNATDIRSLRYPTISELDALGRAVKPGIDQRRLDDLAKKLIPSFDSSFAQRQRAVDNIAVGTYVWGMESSVSSRPGRLARSDRFCQASGFFSQWAPPS